MPEQGPGPDREQQMHMPDTGQLEAGHEFDHLLGVGDSSYSIEDSAVRPERPENTPLTPEEEARIDAALRERTPRPPLTGADVSKLEINRGRSLTDAEIDDMNAARAAGIHTSIV